MGDETPSSPAPPDRGTPEAASPSGGSGRAGAAGLICALVTMAFGAATLLGWATGRRFLSAFDDASIPMAPSTALLFVILGAVAGVAARPGRGRGARIGTSGIAGLAALATLLLLLASVRGTYWAVEHLGLRIAGPQ